MEITIEDFRGEQIKAEAYFSQKFKGRGGWVINCEVYFKGEMKTFRHYITDSRFIDRVADMRADDASWNELQIAYKEKVLDSMTESIIEWCEEVRGCHEQ